MNAALQSEILALSQKTDERFDLVDFRIDTLNKKIDAVAADLVDHSRDTDALQARDRVRQE